MAGVGVFGPEPAHAGCLAEDLRCSQRPAPGDRDQRWRLNRDQSGELGGELVYLRSELTAPASQDACQARDRPLEASDAPLDLVQSADPVQ